MESHSNGALKSWDKPVAKFIRFTDKIDPYNKVHWQRNILAVKESCKASTVDDSYKDASEVVSLRDIDDRVELVQALSNKLKMCHIIFDFTRNTMTREKELKKKLLSEVLEYLIHGKEAITSEIYPLVLNMVKKNLFRKLPEVEMQHDFEDAHLAREPAWPHYGLVYEIFLQFLKSPEFKITPARAFIQEDFVDQILNLFQSQDKFERHLLKKVLIEIYKKFIVLRSRIRRTFYDFCWRYTFESRYVPGLPELMEFYSNVISGLMKPLGSEHLLFFKNVFLKLHSCFMFPAYFTQYVDCLYEFLLMDPTLYKEWFRALKMYWPKTCTRKQILFLNEMSDLLTDISDGEFVTLMVPLFRFLSKVLNTANHFVTEAVMDLLYNTRVCTLVYAHHTPLMSIILPSLIEATFDLSNPEKDRINLVVKRYQMKLKDSSFTTLHYMSSKEKSDLQVNWKQLWSMVDYVEKTFLPKMKPLTAQKKIVEEVEAEVVHVSEKNRFWIFHEDVLPEGLFNLRDLSESLLPADEREVFEDAECEADDHFSGTAIAPQRSTAIIPSVESILEEVEEEEEEQEGFAEVRRSAFFGGMSEALLSYDPPGEVLTSISTKSERMKTVSKEAQRS